MYRGWVENIDAELCGDNQPGCSGINNVPKPIDSTPMEDSDTEENDQQKENPILTFAEKVTIAGLEEAFKAEYKDVRIMFRIALLAAFIMIIYEANIMSDQYHDMTNIILKEINHQPPFPNISVCFPPFINVTNILEKVSDLVIPDRLRMMMRNHNTTFYDILELIQRSYTFNATAHDSSTRIFLMTRMLWDAFRDKAIQENGRAFDFFEYLCSSGLSNCTFGNKIVDCCQYTQTLDILQKRCRNIQPDKMKDNLTEENGLIQFSFHAMIDWTFGLDGISDGFDIFIGKTPGQQQVPITVPSGMDAVIALAQPRLIHQAEDCWLAEEVPKMKYLDYYHQDGIGCQYEEFADMLEIYFNCRIPGLSYIPLANESCTYSQMSAFYVAMIGDYGDSKLITRKQTEEAFKHTAEVARGSSNCKPLCTRWISHVHSTSYSQIQYNDQSQHLHLQMQNKSWSRIRIIMPDTTYMDHQEIQTKVWYLAMCDIGGMMGVYAGFSAVTFIQIIAYGAYVIWWKWENRHKGDEPDRNKEKVGPSTVEKPKPSRIPILVDRKHWQVVKARLQNRNRACEDLKKKGKIAST